MNILFVHIPHTLRKGNAVVGYDTMSIPVGMFALADILDRNGIKSRILHLGVERLRSSRFCLAQYIREHRVDAVAMDLQWNYQVVDVLDTATKLKETLPKLQIITGGLSATFWATEIITKWPAVDFVIRGESEKPILCLVDALNAGNGYENVPNLTWRRNGRVVVNDLSYRISQDEFDQLDFAAFHLLEHCEDYSGISGCRNAQDAFDDYKTNRLFYLIPGRGCHANCAFCGGSRESYRLLFGRETPMLMRPEPAFKNCMRAMKMGFNKLHLLNEFSSATEKFYLDTFRYFRAAGVRPPAVLDCSAPPSPEMFREFAATFDAKQSSLDIFLFSDDRDRRAFFNGFSFTNDEVEKLAALAKDLGVQCRFRVIIFPGETTESTIRFASWLNSMVDRYDASIFPQIQGQDPASPWHINPDIYGITPTVFTAEDFYNLHNRNEVDSPIDLGYDFDNHRSLWLIFNAHIRQNPTVFCAELDNGDSDSHRIVAKESSIDVAFNILKSINPSCATLFVESENDDDGLALLAKIGEFQQDTGLLKSAFLRPATDASTPPILPYSKKPPDVKRDSRSVCDLILDSRESFLAFLKDFRSDAAISNLSKNLNKQGYRLQDMCRWVNTLCPAPVYRLLNIDSDGGVRPCAAGDSVGSAGRNPASAAASLRKIAEKIEQRRGCAQCLDYSNCSRCIFTAPLTEDEFCFIIRLSPDQRAEYTPSLWDIFPIRRTRMIGLPKTELLMRPLKPGDALISGWRLLRPVHKYGAIYFPVTNKNNETIDIHLSRHDLCSGEAIRVANTQLHVEISHDTLVPPSHKKNIIGSFIHLVLANL